MQMSRRKLVLGYASCGRRCRGFTLAELTIVTLILAILAVVSVPKYAASADHYRTQAAANRIAADLLLARQHARATSSSQTVQFTEASDNYVLVGMNDPNHSSDEYSVDLLKTGYPAKLAIVDLGGGDSVTFDQFGKPDAGGSVVVQSGDSERTVTLDSTTGIASAD